MSRGVEAAPLLSRGFKLHRDFTGCRVSSLHPTFLSPPLPSPSPPFTSESTPIRTARRINRSASPSRALFPCSFVLCSIFIRPSLYAGVIYRAAKRCSQFSSGELMAPRARETIVIDTPEAPPRAAKKTAGDGPRPPGVTPGGLISRRQFRGVVKVM